MSTHAGRSRTHVKDPVVHVRVRWVMEHLNNLACTKGVKSLQNVEAGHCTEEEEEEEEETKKKKKKKSRGEEEDNDDKEDDKEEEDEE